MNIHKVRALLGDTQKPYMFEDVIIEAFSDEANEYLVAAALLDAWYTSNVLNGAGSSIKTDDLSINQYNNYILLRDRAKDLRAKGEALLQEVKDNDNNVGVYWPGEFGVHPRIAF